MDIVNMKQLSKGLLALSIVSLSFISAENAKAATAEGEVIESIEHLKPLSVVHDANNVELLTGKYKPQLPVLSISAAPRLSLHTMQQFDSKVNVKRFLDADTSFHRDYFTLSYGGDTSESFKCSNVGCEAANNTFSELRPYVNERNKAGTIIYEQAKTGIRVTYNKMSSFFIKNPDDTTVGIYQRFAATFYASSIVYPDGEVIKIEYDTADNSGINTLYRPTKVTTNLGYAMLLSYHSDDLATGASGWSKVKEAKIVTLDSNDNVIETHAKQSYKDGNDAVTNLDNRSWSYTGFDSALGNLDTAKNFTFKLPGDTQNTLNISSESKNYAGVTHNRFVTSVNNNGKQYTYNYTARGGDGYDPYTQFSKIDITGPAGYSRTVNLEVTGAPNHGQKITSDTINGKTTTYTYAPGSNSKIKKVTLPELNSVEFFYDAYGNVVKKIVSPKPGTNEAPIVYEVNYDLTNCQGFECVRPTWSKDPENHKTEYTYNAEHGMLEVMLEPAGKNGLKRKTNNTYTKNGAGIWRLTRTDIYGCDDCSREPDNAPNTSLPGDVITYTYFDNTHLIATVTRTNELGENPEVTTYGYDSKGNIVSIDGPAAGSNDKTYFKYDNSGRLTWEIGGLSDGGYRLATNTIYRTQDNQPDTVSIGTVNSAYAQSFTTLLRTQEYDYNSKGLVTSLETLVDSAVEQKVTYGYNSQNLKECEVIRMNPETFTGASGCSLGSVSELYGADRKKTFTYDALGRLEEIIAGVGTTVQAREIGMTYTSNGLIQTRTDGNNNTTSYSYDGHDRLATTTFPNQKTQKYTYYADGMVKTMTKRDGTTFTHTYDARNNPSTKTIPGETTLHYHYDEHDRLSHKMRGTNSKKTVHYTYNGAGRIATESTGSRTLTYGYDGNRRNSVTFPDNKVFTFDYDGAGALTHLKHAGSTLVEYNFDNRGKLDSINRFNGLNTDVNQNDLGQLTLLDHARVLQSRFGYNPASQIVSRDYTNSDFVMPPVTGVPTSYVTNNMNQYTAVNGQTVSNDNAGNVTGVLGWTYGYDKHNMLISASASGTNLTLGYDAEGRLNSTTHNGTTIEYLYSGDELVAEYTSSGTLLRRYIHGAGNDDPVVSYEGSSTANSNAVYLLADERGSIIAEADAQGALTEKYQYGPYGELASTRGSKFRYTGQLLLPGTEIYYYKARIYHPKLGRFLQTDPIGYEDGMNWYAYVGNDPVNMVDPTGESSQSMAELHRALRDPATKKALAAGAKDVANAIKSGDFSKLSGSVEEVAKAIYTAKYAEGSSGGKRRGKGHTRAANKLGREINKIKNGGEMKCPTCGKTMNEPQQSVKGGGVDKDAAVGDHVDPKAKGGDGASLKDMRNHETICWECNSKKSDN